MQKGWIRLGIHFVPTPRRRFRGPAIVIIVDRMEEAVDQLRAIIIAERCRKRKKTILSEKVKQWEEHHGKNYSGGLSETGGKPV
jgi:hypothetical protein